jgi:hypothetical protein
VIVGLPPLPVTVKAYVPFATAREAVTVRVVELPVAGLGENVPVTPEGKPLTDMFSGEVNPPTRLIVTV